MSTTQHMAPKPATKREVQVVVARAPAQKQEVKREIQTVNGTLQYVYTRPKTAPSTSEEPSEKVKPISPEISRRIVTARVKLGLTQAEFAQKAGIAVNILRAYESGNAIPTSMELQRLGAAAGENFRKNSHKQ